MIDKAVDVIISKMRVAPPEQRMNYSDELIEALANVNHDPVELSADNSAWVRENLTAASPAAIIERLKAAREGGTAPAIGSTEQRRGPRVDVL